MASKGSGTRVVVFDERNKIHTYLRNSLLESIESFYHLPACVSFIQQNAKDERATVLVTTSVENQTLQTFEALHPIEAVLILSITARHTDTLPSKVVGIYPKIELLVQVLYETLDTVELQLDANSILFHRERDGSDNTDFYFYSLWKTHYTSHVTKKELIDQGRVLFRSETRIKAAMQDFYTSYKPSKVLHWLDKYNHPFPYHLLVSNALRTHDQQILSIVRFFILDLSKQMKPLPIGPSYNQVYFGIKLPISTVDRLEQQTSRDIISFQCFLPTTRSRTKALLAATKPSRRRKMANVLFKIDASHALCAHLTDVILIDMATPFHITCVTRNTGFGGVQQLVTIVTLVSLDRETREQLFEQFIQRQKKAGRTINDFIYQTIPLVESYNGYGQSNTNRSSRSHNHIPLYVVSVMKTDRDSLAVCDDEAEADQLIARGNWAQAVDALARIDDPNVRVLNKQGCLLRERLHDLPGALECHQQALAKATDRGKIEALIYLGIVYHDMKQYEEALKCYSQALDHCEREKPRNTIVIARCLVGLGNTHWARGELDQALDCAERALALREHEIKPKNEFEIAASLGNVGSILLEKGDTERALEFSKRAVDILSKFGKNDPRLAAALNNLGVMYQACGDYTKAREYFERALESVPDDDHPHRTSTLKNIARLNNIEKEEE